MSILILFSHLHLGLLKSLFPLGLPYRTLKALLHFLFWLYDFPFLIFKAILGERYKLYVPHCGAFSIPYSQPPLAQIFAYESCFQIPLAFIPPLM